MRFHTTLALCALSVAIHWSLPRSSYAQGSVSSVSIRPFVTGWIPIRGRSGDIGGVSIDPAGVVMRSDIDRGRELQDAWIKAGRPITGDLRSSTKMRMVSLTRLDRELAKQVGRDGVVPDELFFLAGLQRLEYIFVLPDRNDIVIAGPAGAFEVDERGEMVGSESRYPLLRLDDLIEALRTAEAAAAGHGITCSINPSEEGITRFSRLMRQRGLQPNKRTAELMEKAVGPQAVTLTGVSPDSHFASVMVGADFLMKRLAMGLEPAPVDDMPSYMELAAKLGVRDQLATPRWWLAVNYDSLLRSEDRLAWKLRGSGVKAMTEDGYVSGSGEVVRGGKNRAAEQWAATMTAKYDELARRLPMFRRLRNCMDMAVAAAVITRHDLASHAGCNFKLLSGSDSVRGPVYNVPRTIGSQAAFIRAGRGWIVSVSGGIDVDSWSVTDETQISETLASTHHRIDSADASSWWWD